MAITVQAANGVALPIDSLSIDITWGSNGVTSMATVYNGITYVLTVGYTGVNPTSLSQWVNQS